jgi:glutathione peroxidase
MVIIGSGCCSEILSFQSITPISYVSNQQILLVTLGMTLRQSILKRIYPLWMWLNKQNERRKKILRNDHAQPSQSFYSLSTQLNNGTELNFNSLKGKKVLLVNTASDCGYTNQYADLQKLFETNQDRLIIIGFPANDFKEQEKGTDEEIAQFCKVNYGVTFPIAKKTTVKGDRKNEIFQWLSEKNKNGWNDKQPSWNFSKYLVDERGRLTHYFDPAVSPLSDEVIRAITKN